MAIQIIYVPFSKLAPKSGAKRVANKWYGRFIKAGFKDVLLRKFDYSDIRKCIEHDVIISSEVDYRELCYLIIYDDQVKGKYLTNESEELSFQDVIPFFRPRDYRKIERRMLMAQLDCQS